MSKINNKVTVGIDLGTTFCSISIWNEQTKQPEIIQIKTKDQIPSWVSFSNYHNNLVSCGWDAKNDVEKEYIVYDVKRIIGKKEGDPFIDDNYPFKVQVDEQSPEKFYVIKQNLPDQPNKEIFNPEEISGFIVYYLIKQLEKLDEMKGKEIGKVVVGVPCQFLNDQRGKTEEALKLAGIKNFQLIHEPSAAGLEYLRIYENDKEKKLNVGDKFVVVDFGGGTLDICCCILEKDGTVLVVSNGGNQNLGGNDFDYEIKKLINKKLKEEGIIKKKYFFENDDSDEYDSEEDSDSDEEEEEEEEFKPPSESEYNKRQVRLQIEAERIKIKLSTNDESIIDLSFLLGKDLKEEMKETEIKITKNEFEECIGKVIPKEKPKKKKKTQNNSESKKVEWKLKEDSLLHQFQDKLDQIFGASRFRKEDVKVVLPIGGTCKIPIVKEIIEKKFPNKIADIKFDGLTAVCKGCCFYSTKKSTGIAETQPKDILKDGLPTAIGVKSNGTNFSKIIEEGTHLPTKRSQKYHTDSDDQERIDIEVYQGTGYSVENSQSVKKIKSITIEDLPKKPKGEVNVDVTFQLDENGLLNIDVRVDGKEPKKDSVNVDLSVPDEKMKILQDHFDDFASRIDPELKRIQTVKKKEKGEIIEEDDEDDDEQL